MDDLHRKLDVLIERYSDSPYVLRSLEHHIDKVLPNMLESVCERKERQKTLKGESDIFMCAFMAKHRVYYCPHNEIFYAYDGVYFTSIREDEVCHNILANITADDSLRPWKHRTKISTISAIKRRSPLTVIPESDTIQNVLSLFHPSLFSSRNRAKFFLTVVGDALLDKTPNGRIYLASPILKELVRRMGDNMSEAFGVHGALNEIKFKYHGHDHSQLRLLFIDEKRKRLETPPFLNKRAMDVMCVAAHYSKRYNSADGFLEQTLDESLSNHALFMKRHSIEELVDAFIANSIQHCPNTTILSKQMLFLWKKHLQTLNVPNVVFYEPLLALFKERLNYTLDGDAFVDITSPLLPVVATFLEFWDTNMIADEDDYNELEMNEVIILLNRWAHRATLEECILVELIRHFYPDTILEEGKYILGVRCTLWNKRQEVIDNLEVFRVTAQSGASLYDAYEHYSGELKGRLGVSKRYYEKVAHDWLGNQVSQYGIFDSIWFV